MEILAIGLLLLMLSAVPQFELAAVGTLFKPTKPKKRERKEWEKNLTLKSTPSAPPAPDYTAAADATAQGNLQYAEYTTQANHVNQTNPYGSITYTNTGTAAHPVYNQTETLTPELQSALDSQIQTQSNLSQDALDLNPQVQANLTNPFNAPQLSTYESGTPAVNTAATQINTSGVPGVDYNMPTSESYTAGAGTTNLNAPQYNPANNAQYAAAAYNAANSFLAPQYAQQQQQLSNSMALQGLAPSSQASNQGQEGFSQAEDQAYNQLANQSILTGEQLGTQDYDNQLQGFQAGNTAQNQAYTQGLQSQQADIAAAQAQNQAQAQGYGQALDTATAQEQAQQAQNAAEQQAYTQGLSNYQTNYGADYAAYMQPLNSLNALESGQQVQNPTFASYPLQQQTAGPNLLGAAESTAAYNQGIYNTQAASATGSNDAAMGAAATIGAAAIMM